MAEWRSQYCSTDNEYILFRIWVRETATNVIANTSTLRITVYAWRTNDYTTNYGGGCNVKIDGTARGYQYWDWNEKPVYYDSDTVLYDEENIVINHNSDGTKSINVQATCEWYADGSIYIDSPYQGFDITLTALDRGAPSVYHSVSSIGVNSFVINASANSNCDMWDYSIDNGANWTRFSNTVGTSASVTVTGLSPNTTYNTRVRARRQYNTVWGYYGPVSAKTLGNAILNSVATITADAATVTISFNATVYVPSYKHTLELNRGDTLGTMISLTNLTLTNGTNTVTLTAAQRNTLLSNFPNAKTFTVSVSLYTYSGSTLIGSVSTKTVTAQTTAANSAPTFTGFTYQDNNSAVVSVTGNNQIMVQNASTVRVNITAATAKNSATIKSYSVAFGNLSTSSTSTTVTMGTITTSGTVVMTVTAIDSRGYSTSRSTNVTVVAYSKIVYTSSTIRRTNEVENTIQLSFAGNRKAITISGTEKNSIIYCRYRYKKTSDSTWSSYTDILSQVTTSGLNFSFSNNALVNLDAEYSWNVEVLIQDKLTHDTLSLVVGQGIPLMSFRNKKVGINVLNPTRSLDVGGDGIKCQPGTGVTYISGCAGNHAGLYVTKTVGANYWIPGLTVQTNGGGGWAIGNYNDEALEFAYGTKANIDASNNVVSHIYLTADGTNQQRWICSTANGPSNNLIAVGDGTTSGIKNSGYGITTSISSSQTTKLVTSAAVATGTLLRNTFVPQSTSYSADDMRGMTRFLYQTVHGVPATGTTVSFDSSNNTNYPFQLNARYSGVYKEAKMSFRTRDGDSQTWSSWLDCGMIHKFPNQVGANSTVTFYVPNEMRDSNNTSSYLFIASNPYAAGGLWFLQPHTASSHTMVVTALKSTGFLTVAGSSDDWAIKLTTGNASFWCSLLKLS